MELKKVELPVADDYGAFRGPDGQMIIGQRYGLWAYSSDGVSYHQLSIFDQKHSTTKGVRREVWAYADPHDARRGRLFVQFDEHGDPSDVELDGISFAKVDVPTEIMLLQLPPMRVTERVYWRACTRQVILLSRCRYEKGSDPSLEATWLVDSERLFVGGAADLSAGGIADLTEVPIDRPLEYVARKPIDRYRTAEGTLDVPYGRDVNDRRRTATWKGERLVELMLERLLIVETDDRVTLCLNPGDSSWDNNTNPLAAQAAWDQLMADAQDRRPIESLAADLRDPAKRAQATIDVGPSVTLTDIEELLCPAQAGHPARLASSLAAGVNHLLEVGRAGRRVLIPLPDDHRAAMILGRFQYVQVLSRQPVERDGEPAIEVICRLTAHTDPTVVRLKLTIGHAASIIDETNNLEYVIDGIEDEDAQDPQPRI